MSRIIFKIFNSLISKILHNIPKPSQAFPSIPKYPPRGIGGIRFLILYQIGYSVFISTSVLIEHGVALQQVLK
jgi:hypothetical protein